MHGWTPEDVMHDKEGIYTMRSIASGMICMLKLLENGQKNGIIKPIEYVKETTDFIR
jgi:hypothetical protein